MKNIDSTEINFLRMAFTLQKERMYKTKWAYLMHSKKYHRWPKGDLLAAARCAGDLAPDGEFMSWIRAQTRINY